jgi:hypothetical protein
MSARSLSAENHVPGKVRQGQMSLGQAQGLIRNSVSAVSQAFVLQAMAKSGSRPNSSKPQNLLWVRRHLSVSSGGR